jgi:hypothetical protein
MLEPSCNRLEMSHSASASSFPSLGLHAPIVLSRLCSRIPTASTRTLLNVVGSVATSPADRVTLVVPETEGARSFRH